MTLTLSPAETAMATAVGQARRANALERGRPAYYGFNDANPDAVDINAAGGELAAALVYDLPWTGCYFRRFDRKMPDIGTATEVRTRTKPWHSLIVHPEDADDWVFVLVNGTLPTYTVVGSITGAAAKSATYWSDPAGGRPAYFVPERALEAP